MRRRTSSPFEKQQQLTRLLLLVVSLGVGCSDFGLGADDQPSLLIGPTTVSDSGTHLGQNSQGYTFAGPEACPGHAEYCNGADDDCDGAIDEDIDGLGQRCAEGLGNCAAQGRVVCATDGRTRCDAEVDPDAAMAETCNGRDDDCDGSTDEDAADAGQPCTAGRGACAVDGRLACVSGALICQTATEPPSGGEELCNAIDDDCDGAVDEVFRIDQICTVGVGACARQGIWRCDAAGHISCTEPMAPDSPITARPAGEEACNGVDDDCDGDVDEALHRRCDTGDIGECAHGARVCAGGLWSGCAPVHARAADECDGLDNDCDGLVDEAASVGPCDTDLPGRCRPGRTVCTEDGLVCRSHDLPEDERCNGLDDDCDGAIDEDHPGIGEPCDAGLGACAARGVRVCLGDGSGLTCNARPADPFDPDEALCDGQDGDCDGAVDETWPLGERCMAYLDDRLSVGACACAPDGLIRCAVVDGERERMLDPVENPAGADGHDNDCDHRVDE